jgi:hypothetical protein
MQFDNNGHLMPYEIQEITLDEFRYFFVEKLGDSGHRTQLFDNYLRFIEDLKASFDVPFYQWVDGSFITTKEFPGDIDVVTFIPSELLKKRLIAVQYFINKSEQLYKVDAKFSPICKWNQRDYQDSKEQESYWFNLFNSSRKNKNGFSNPKGIIKLNFNL